MYRGNIFHEVGNLLAGPLKIYSRLNSVSQESARTCPSLRDSVMRCKPKILGGETEKSGSHHCLDSPPLKCLRLTFAIPLLSLLHVPLYIPLYIIIYYISIIYIHISRRYFLNSIVIFYRENNAVIIACQKNSRYSSSL